MSTDWILGWLLVMFALNSLATVLIIGKPRPRMTPGMAVANLMGNALWAYLILRYLWV